MGSESRCTVHFDRQRSEGKALLETEQLIFRGEFRLVIPRKAITEVDAKDGTLRDPQLYAALEEIVEQLVQMVEPATLVEAA